jgi:4-hydroxy-3-methylbut-2-enyl diphosphate reductase
VVDATCPHVKNDQQAAGQLARAGDYVVIVGELGHPEVEGISAYAGSEVLVVQTPDDLPAKLPTDKIGVVVQTTQPPEALDAIVGELKRRGIEPRVTDTICFATRQRQSAALELAASVDAMIVVGGRNSANTRRLYEICKTVCGRTWHVERPDEIHTGWFDGAGAIGITAGASTPESQIDAVCAYIEERVA